MNDFQKSLSTHDPFVSHIPQRVPVGSDAKSTTATSDWVKGTASADKTDRAANITIGAHRAPIESEPQPQPLTSKKVSQGGAWEVLKHPITAAKAFWGNLPKEVKVAILVSVIAACVIGFIALAAASHGLAVLPVAAILFALVLTSVAASAGIGMILTDENQAPSPTDKKNVDDKDKSKDNKLKGPVETTVEPAADVNKLSDDQIDKSKLATAHKTHHKPVLPEDFLISESSKIMINPEEGGDLAEMIATAKKELDDTEAKLKEKFPIQMNALGKGTNTESLKKSSPSEFAELIDKRAQLRTEIADLEGPKLQSVKKSKLKPMSSIESSFQTIEISKEDKLAMLKFDKHELQEKINTDEEYSNFLSEMKTNPKMLGDKYRIDEALKSQDLDEKSEKTKMDELDKEIKTLEDEIEKDNMKIAEKMAAPDQTVLGQEAATIEIKSDAEMESEELKIPKAKGWVNGKIPVE